MLAGEPKRYAIAFDALVPNLQAAADVHGPWHAMVVPRDSDIDGLAPGESLDEHIVAVPLTPPIEMAVVGSRACFAQHGLPQTPADLMPHNCLAYRLTCSGTIDRWSFVWSDIEGNTVVVEPKGSAVFNDDENMLNAALQGVGVIKYLDICVRQHVAEGRLVRMLAPWCRPFPGFYLYMPSRAQLPAKIRALMDFLIERRAMSERVLE